MVSIVARARQISRSSKVNDGPVAFCWNKKQSDTAPHCKDRTVIKHGRVTEVVRQQINRSAFLLPRRSQTPAGRLRNESLDLGHARVSQVRR